MPYAAPQAVPFSGPPEAFGPSLSAMAQKLPRFGFASAEGLGANPDNLHFSAKALRAFGLRYYAEFKRLAPELSGGKEADLTVTEIEKL